MKASATRNSETVVKREVAPGAVREDEGEATAATAGGLPEPLPGVRLVVARMRHGSRAGGLSVETRHPAALVGREGAEELEILSIPEARPTGAGRGFRERCGTFLASVLFRGLDTGGCEEETEEWNRSRKARSRDKE